MLSDGFGIMMTLIDLGEIRKRTKKERKRQYKWEEKIENIVKMKTWEISFAKKKNHNTHSLNQWEPIKLAKSINTHSTRDTNSKIKLKKNRIQESPKC